MKKYKVFRTDGGPLNSDTLHKYDIKLMKGGKSFLYEFTAQTINDLIDFVNYCSKGNNPGMSMIWDEGVVFTNDYIEVYTNR